MKISGMSAAAASAVAVSVALFLAVSAPLRAQEPRTLGGEQTVQGGGESRELSVESVDLERLHGLMRAAEEGLAYVPGELLVRFKPGMSVEGQAGALRVLSLPSGASRSRWIGDILHVRSQDLDDPEHAAKLLESQPEVLYAHPNYLMHLTKTPNDPLYSEQWNMGAINLPQAWDINPGSRSDVVVAVIDSGLTTGEGTFGLRLWAGPTGFRTFGVPFARTADFAHDRVVNGRDFVFGVTPLFDAVGHGTHVAGTVAQQTDNALGYAGVAYSATIMPLKVCIGYWDLQIYMGIVGEPGFVDTSFTGGCPTDAVVAALRYAADQGAEVANMSLGGSTATPAYLDALRYAVGKGTFVAMAAGNEALVGNPTAYPASYAAQVAGAVAVGAVNRALVRSNYSNFGSYVEIAAPGGDSQNRIWQVHPNPADIDSDLLVPRFDRYVGVGLAGTSMASPHIAGVAALLYSQGITDPAAIEAAMTRFATDLGSAGRDDDFGHGLVDARATLRGLGVAR